MTNEPNSGAWQHYLLEVLPECLGRDRCGDITPLDPAAQVPDGIVALDSVEKFLIRSARGHNVGVALCSSPVAPELVARGMWRAREAKKMLGARLGLAILDPLFEGAFEGRTCAVLPYCHPLSGSRWIRKIQKKTMAPALIRWFRGAAEATRYCPGSAEVRRSFSDCLTCLSEEDAVSDSVRRAAGLAMERMDRGQWEPCHVLCHNDVWDGNILIDRRAAGDGLARAWNDRFVIIDWPGSTLRGYGLIDLMRLARTLPITERRLRGEVAAHCEILGCGFEDARSHLLAAIGNILMHRENFPMPLFVKMADACLDRLESVGG